LQSAFLISYFGLAMSFSFQYSYLKEDWIANSGNTRGRLVMSFFRIAKMTFFFPTPFRIITAPLRAIYTLIVGYILGIDVPLQSEIGGACRLFHGMGLVVHPGVVIGRNCLLRQGVTIGELHTGSAAVPIIGDDVEFGCNSVVLGAIHIGDGAQIGAGAIVIQSVPKLGVVFGVAAKVVRIREHL
jgi:serine acetyltransferase